MRAGAAGEARVGEHLTDIGWTILARNVRVGRSELDLVAVDPGPPATLVVVEVRANRTSRFGLPEESVDREKLRAVYRGALALRGAAVLPGGTRLPRLPLRVDVVSIEIAPRLRQSLDGMVLRHLRGAIG
jgi:putative endonuclease